jgi:hypothetical protein
MRTEILRSTLVKPLLAAFGGTKERSYVDFDRDALHVRFGWLFDEKIPYERITSAERVRWPFIGGLGWRTNFIDTVALVGSYDNVVRLRLAPAVSVRMLKRMDVESLYVSVEDVDAFLAEIRKQRAARVV